MLDYHGDYVALEAFSTGLAGTAFVDPVLTKAQGAAVGALGTERGAALVGAFLHHLIAQAASDGAEIALLRRATNLWHRGSGLCNDLATQRAQLQAALDNPAAPGAADQFNNAAVGLQKLTHTLNVLRVDVDAFRSDVLAFPHLPRHPRQEDRPTSGWDWGNLTLGRRTDALVRALFRRAGDAASMAFALGACASYGGNIAGSAYLGQTVGGPRRLHRYRDRLARNAFGSWLAANHPGTVAPSVMGHMMTMGPAAHPALPSALEKLVHDSLADTFDLTRTGPLPDLQLGYSRVVEHLQLLEGFVQPPVPAPPGPTWMAALFGDPANPPPSLRPQNVDVVGQDGGGVAGQYGGDPSAGSSKSDNSDLSTVCGIVVALLILIDLLQAFIQCIGQWANKHTCTFWDNMLLKKLWEQDPPDPRDPTHPTSPGVSSSQLTAAASSPQMAQLVWMLFDAHSQAWEALDRAYDFLAVTGLIYPQRLLAAPLYTQFTSLPPPSPWPHREAANEPNVYHLYPASSLENPAEQASPFATNAVPDAYLQTGSDISRRLWEQIALGGFDSSNFDLDADRGFEALCWAARGSVTSDPIDVVTLAYTDQ